MLELAERLIGKGFDVKIHDANVIVSRLIGANRSYIDERLPHIGELLVDDVDAVVAHGEVLIVASRAPEVLDALSRAGSERLIIDLVRLPDAGQRRETANYQGIGW